jgi:Ring finger domain
VAKCTQPLSRYVAGRERQLPVDLWPCGDLAPNVRATVAGPTECDRSCRHGGLALDERVGPASIITPMDLHGEEEGRPQTRWFYRVIRFVLGLLCCDWIREDMRYEHEHVPSDSGGFTTGRRHIRGQQQRPLQDVAESSSLLQGSSPSCCKPSKMSPQEKQFRAMKKPSFSTAVFTGKSMDEDSCLICLEEFTDDNPRIHLKCGHGYHLGCMLEWQERGRTECPLCHAVSDSMLDES